MKKYKVVSNEDREKIYNAYNSQNLTMQKISEIFNCGYKTVQRILKQKRTTGMLCKKQQGGFKKQYLTAEEAQVIQNLIDVDATITLKEIKYQTGYAVSLQCIACYIRRFSYSFKRISVIAVAADAPGIWEQRRIFALWFLEMRTAGRSIVFTDEVGFQFSARTSRGRSKKGEKCQIVGPCLRSKNITVMAGLTDSTILHYDVLENNGNALAYEHFWTTLLELETTLIFRKIPSS